MTLKSKPEKPSTPILADDELLEDGWIFRERPGVPVECVRRAPLPRDEISPYQPRLN
jgi:hypothetical protein